MGKENSNRFYAELPVVEDFFVASDETSCHSLPDDWYVCVTDIVNSTSAVENDRYKTVNILGASPIVGILNIADRKAVPYVFGGDGAAICIPPDLEQQARRVLAGCRRIGKAEYGLDLRAAIIPVGRIHQSENEIRVARYRASEHYIQAIFTGGGISYAERMLKNPETERYRVPISESAEEVDFSGLECRWQEVSKPDREVITLMVKSNPANDNSASVYKDLLNTVGDIFGFGDNTNPVDASRLTMNTSLRELMGEIKFRTFGKGVLHRLWYILKMELEIILGKLFMMLDYRSSETDWSLYKSDMVKSNDHRKFDDMLRLVISGQQSQRAKLEKYLERKFRNGKLAYGLHLADTAMITCMVFRYHRDHVHFVDGSDGGYVTASQGLKKRLRELTSRSEDGDQTIQE